MNKLTVEPTSIDASCDAVDKEKLEVKLEGARLSITTYYDMGERCKWWVEQRYLLTESETETLFHMLLNLEKVKKRDREKIPEMDMEKYNNTRGF